MKATGKRTAETRSTWIEEANKVPWRCSTSLWTVQKRFTHKLCIVTNRFSCFCYWCWLWQNNLWCWWRCIRIWHGWVMHMWTSCRAAAQCSLSGTCLMNKCFHCFSTTLRFIFFIEMHLSQTITNHLDRQTSVWGGVREDRLSVVCDKHKNERERGLELRIEKKKKRVCRAEKRNKYWGIRWCETEELWMCSCMNVKR